MSWIRDEQCFQFSFENNSCDPLRHHRSESGFGPTCINSAIRRFEQAVCRLQCQSSWCNTQTIRDNNAIVLGAAVIKWCGPRHLVTVKLINLTNYLVCQVNVGSGWLIDFMLKRFLELSKRAINTFDHSLGKNTYDKRLRSLAIIFKYITVCCMLTEVELWDMINIVVLDWSYLA